LKTLFQCAKGSVSVFFIITTAAMFFFNAVLIDFTRIVIAEKHTENAVKAAARSVMSGYDNDLRTYGLFGVGFPIAERKNVFEKVVIGNIETDSRGDYFPFIQLSLKPATARVNSLYSLAHQHVFEQQLLEEMKYKAPVEFGRNVVDKFSNVSQRIRAARNFTDNASAIDKLVNQRDQVMEEVWNISSKIMEQFDQSYRKNADDLAKAATSKAALDDDLLAMQRAVEHKLTILNDLYLKLNEALNKAEQYDANIANTLTRANEVMKGDIPDDPDYLGALGRVHILGDRYFALYKTDTAEVYASFSAYVRAIKSKPAESEHHVQSVLQNLNDNYYEKAVQWHSAIVKGNDQWRQQSESNKRLQEQEVRKTKSQLDQSKSYFFENSCNTENDKRSYRRLTGNQGFYEAYLNYNRIQHTTNQLTHTPYDSPVKELGSDSLSLLKGMTNILQNMTREIYVNEYVLMNFNNRIPDQGPRAGHMLNNQETEYVIYGLSSCQMNLSAAYVEMFMLRIGLRLVEALADPKTLAAGSPMLAVLTALSTATAKAYSDMRKLLSGENVPLLDAARALSLNYKDYLRIILFLHSHDLKRMSRIQALIQLNTGKDLRKKPTYVQASAKTSVKIWFVPPFMKGLTEAGLLKGEVVGNRYEMSKFAFVSY
jgi:hypothetical protein